MYCVRLHGLVRIDGKPFDSKRSHSIEVCSFDDEGNALLLYILYASACENPQNSIHNINSNKELHFIEF